MARLIDESSIRQADKGFQNVAIGKVTHSKLRHLANERGVSMASIIKAYVESELSGKQGVLVEQKATIADVRADVQSLKSQMAAIVDWLVTPSDNAVSRWCDSVIKRLEQYELELMERIESKERKRSQVDLQLKSNGEGLLLSEA